MDRTPKQNYYQELANKKRDFPALIIDSKSSFVVYSHHGTGPKYDEFFKEFKSFHEQAIGTSLLASLSDSDRTALQNWLDILYDETYVELMMPEDIVKLCPSFSLTWTDGQNYEVRFEAIKTENIYEYVLVWLEPHGHTQQQQLASEIIELMSELRTAPREVINNLKEYLPEVTGHINLANYADVESSDELIKQLSRHLHAAKGTTFFLGFSTLGQACHDAESKLEELRKTWQLSDGLQPVREIFGQLYLLLNLAEGISTKVYTATKSDTEHLMISRADYYQVVEHMVAIHEESKQILIDEKPFLARFDQLYFDLLRFDSVALDTIFERLNSSANQLSKELEKSVMFSIAPHSPTVFLPHRIFDSLWNALYQVLKNSLDHGIEAAPIREKNGKPGVAQILFSVVAEEGHLILKIRDDGKGINPQTIIQTALERKLISPKKAKKLATSKSQDEVYELLFSPGFSTQKDVTTISGRGVGTDVIREEVETYEGHISVSSELGSWTEFSLFIPIEANNIIVTDD
ncbi:MAG: Hpt domain-containing protein [SAR324 cluster bacterium]|nr:Hpt domain-containing protein [SAR324 cluster bacterium]